MPRHAKIEQRSPSKKATKLRGLQKEASPELAKRPADLPLATPRGWVVSLYSGAGGMDFGFEWAGFRSLWANDISADAVATYNASRPPERRVGRAGDVRGLRSELRSVVAALRARGETLDLVIGGPPCQGFSVAGKMDPDDPRSRHVWEFVDIVRELRPKAFVMENVKALYANRRWEGLRANLLETACNPLAGSEGQRYNARYLLLNASHYGVPQARERMFLVGALGRPVPDPRPTTDRRAVTVREVLERLPRFGAPGNNTMCVAKITTAQNPVMRKSPFAGMLFNGQGRPMDLEKPAPTLPASMGGNRTPIVDQQTLEKGGKYWVSEYHSTLQAGKKPVASVPQRLRRLTVEEAAALQTFPEGMQWVGPQSARFRQVGNAVPPMLAYHVACAVRAVL